MTDVTTCCGAGAARSRPWPDAAPAAQRRRVLLPRRGARPVAEPDRHQPPLAAAAVVADTTRHSRCWRAATIAAAAAARQQQRLCWQTPHASSSGYVGRPYTPAAAAMLAECRRGRWAWPGDGRVAPCTWRLWTGSKRRHRSVLKLTDSKMLLSLQFVHVSSLNHKNDTGDIG